MPSEEFLSGSEGQFSESNQAQMKPYVWWDVDRIAKTLSIRRPKSCELENSRRHIDLW